MTLGADYDATLASIEDAVSGVRGVDREVVTYSTQKIRDVGALEEGDNPIRSNDLDVLTGAREPLVVRVYGQELDVLRGEARKLRQLVAGVDGVVDPRIEAPVTQPTVEIEVDLGRAQREAIKPGDVRRAEAVLLQGIQVGSVFEEQKVFDVVVQGVPETRRSVANVRNLLIDTPDGDHVRLREVADVRVSQTPIAIQREAVSRYLDIEADVSGRSLEAVASDVEGRLADVSFPLEYHAEVLQKTTGEEINGGQILAFAGAAAIAIFLLLQAAFRSWRLAVLAFLALPVALVGGVLAALIDGAELSLGSMLAFLALFGLAARHSVVPGSSPSGARGPAAAMTQRARVDRARGAGAAGAGADEHRGNRAGDGAVCDRRRHPGPRSRPPDGDRHPGWARHHDAAGFVRVAHPLPAVRGRRAAERVPRGGDHASVGRHRARAGGPTGRDRQRARRQRRGNP